MAIISENFESRAFSVNLTTSERQLMYDVQNAVDEDDVLATVLATCPAVYDYLILDSVEATCIDGQSPGLWRAIAKYVRLSTVDEYTFDIGGGATHVTQSYGTVAYPAPGFVAPDFGGAIGVSEDRVEGVDVPGPSPFTWTETHYLDQAAVDATYKRNLMTLASQSYNVATFRGLNPGECAFLGATGTLRGIGQWAIVYKFAGSANTTTLMLGSIGPITKLGWDYLWVRYATFADGSAFSLVPRPIAAYVEQVLIPMDYTLLGIGT